MYVKRVPILTDSIHIDHRHLQRPVVVDGRVREPALDRGVDGGAADDAARDGLVDQVAAGDGGGLAEVEGSVEEEGEGEGGEGTEGWHFGEV